MGNINLEVLATKLEFICKQIEDLQNKLDDSVVLNEKQHSKLYDQIDNLNGRYSGKWVEKVVITVIAVIVTSISVVLGVG